MVAVDFYSEGEEEEGRLIVSFVEIECLILEFHVNFNRN